MNRAVRQEQALMNAAEAQRFVEDPQFKQAVANAEAAIYWKWRTSKPEDQAEREALYHEQQALNRIQKQLTKPMAEATFARAERDRDNFQANLE